MNVTFFMVDQKTSEGVRAGLASNLRRLRVAHHLSLSELARTTGMSKATLSGIERGNANPTVDTLAALAGALRVSMAELLQVIPVGEMRVVRAAQNHLGSPDSVGQRILEVGELDGTAELLELSLPTRHVREEGARAAGSRTQVLVLQGKLIAGPIERISELSTGDYASFPADGPHLYETTRVIARALVLNYTPPLRKG
jgi:transcriptional regulator with XRE-family HTH domain